MCLIVPLLLGAALLGAYLLTPLRERLSPREFAGDGRFVQVGGYAVHYQDDGPADAPPVLLAHGFGASLFTWRAQRRALLEAGFRVIATDQLGAGASERAIGPVYTTQQQAALLLGVLDALGVEAATVVGHSYGGRVAMQFALDAPARVRALALIAPEAYATARPPVARLVEWPILGYALAFYATAPRLVRPGLQMVSQSRAWLTDAAVEGYAAPAAVRGSTQAQIWHARSPKDRPGEPPVPARLASITQRTLILWGERDPVFPAADGQRLAATLPNARLHILPGAGHLPHEEQPDAVNSLLLDFLGRA